MKVAFLTGERVVLGPPASGEAGLVAQLPLLVAPGPGRGPSVGPDPELHLFARDGGGALLGRLSLVGIDWVARRAGLSVRFVEGDARALEEALRLAVRYAFDELGLERVEAAQGGDVLRGLGARSQGVGVVFERS